MKKALYLLLISVVVFSLCACGGSPTSAPADPAGAAPSAAEDIPAVPEHVDELVVEDARIITENNGRRELEVKIRNNYADSGDRQYPNRFAVSFQFLDDSGDVLSSDEISTSDMVWISDLDYQQGGWGRMTGWLKDGLTEAASIRFTGYVIGYNPKTFVWREKGTFSTPPVYSIEELCPDILPDPNAEPTFSIENVSLDYADALPSSITGSVAYRAFANAKKGLADSQVYAVLHFTATNLSKQDIDLSEIKEFVVSLDFDNGYVFSTSGRDVYAFESENHDISIRAGGGRANSLTLSPLTTMEYTLYLTCAKAVQEQADKPLIVSFAAGEDAAEHYEFTIR